MRIHPRPLARAAAAAGSVALQGPADFLIFACVAAPPLFAGVLFQLTGRAALNITMLVALGLVTQDQPRQA